MNNLESFLHKAQGYLNDHLEPKPYHFATGELAKIWLPLMKDEPGGELTAFPKKIQTNSPTLDGLRKRVSACMHCHLGSKRKGFVKFGRREARIMVLTDLPDYYDQLNGAYFSGKTGELLDKILMAVGLHSKDAYFSGALKCASTVEIGRDTSREAVCLSYLKEELALQKFNGILALGELTHRLLFPNRLFERDRGQMLSYHHLPILFTDHPRNLLLDASKKKKVWEDLKAHKKQLMSWKQGL